MKGHAVSEPARGLQVRCLCHCDRASPKNDQSAVIGALGRFVRSRLPAPIRPLGGRRQRVAQPPVKTPSSQDVRTLVHYSQSSTSFGEQLRWDPWSCSSSLLPPSIFRDR